MNGDFRTMDYSKAVDLTQAYQTPPSYKPPETLEELAKCTDYPNTNSTHYQLKDPEPRADTKLQPMYELATVNSAGHTIVAGNDYTSRRWAGSFCGWESASDIGVEEKASFGRQCDGSVTALSYTLKDSLVRRIVIGKISVFCIYYRVILVLHFDFSSFLATIAVRSSFGRPGIPFGAPATRSISWTTGTNTSEQ